MILSEDQRERIQLQKCEFMTLVGHSYAWKSHPTLCQKYSNMPTLHTKDIVFAVKKVGRVFNNFVWKLFDLECNIYDHLQSVVTFSIFNIPMPGCRPFALIHNATFAEYQVYLQRVCFSSITCVCSSISVRTPPSPLSPEAFLL